MFSVCIYLDSDRADRCFRGRFPLAINPEPQHFIKLRHWASLFACPILGGAGLLLMRSHEMIRGTGERVSRLLTYCPHACLFEHYNVCFNPLSEIYLQAPGICLELYIANHCDSKGGISLQAWVQLRATAWARRSETTVLQALIQLADMSCL